MNNIELHTFNQLYSYEQKALERMERCGILLHMLNDHRSRRRPVRTLLLLSLIRLIGLKR